MELLSKPSYTKIIQSVKNMFSPAFHSMPAVNTLLANLCNGIDQLPIDSVSIDLMVTEPSCTVEAPFGNLDLECNGLIMDKRCIRTCCKDTLQ